MNQNEPTEKLRNPHGEKQKSPGQQGFIFSHDRYGYKYSIHYTTPIMDLLILHYTTLHCGNKTRQDKRHGTGVVLGPSASHDLGPSSL